MKGQTGNIESFHCSKVFHWNTSRRSHPFVQWRSFMRWCIAQPSIVFSSGIHPDSHGQQEFFLEPASFETHSLRTSSLRRTLSKTHWSLMDIMRPGCKFSDLHEKPSTERRQTLPSDLEVSNAEEVHWSLASLGKLSLRVCIRPKCMSDPLHRSWICTLDVRSMPLLYGFEGSFAMIEAQTFLFLHRKQHGFMVSYLLLQLAQAFVSFSRSRIDWQCDFKTAIERRLSQIAGRAFADLLLWQSCIEAAESECNNDSSVAAQLDDSSKCMDKHSQTTSEEICWSWPPVPPSRMRGQDIWREDRCRCWVGFCAVFQRCCSLVLTFGFATEPSAGCIRSWSHWISELVFLEGGLLLECLCGRKLRHQSRNIDEKSIAKTAKALRIVARREGISQPPGGCTRPCKAFWGDGFSQLVWGRMLVWANRCSCLDLIWRWGWMSWTRKGVFGLGHGSGFQFWEATATFTFCSGWNMMEPHNTRSMHNWRESALAALAFADDYHPLKLERSEAFYCGRSYQDLQNHWTWKAWPRCKDELKSQVLSAEKSDTDPDR